MNPKNRIRELRQREGWRQDDLAARLNTKRQTIGHYETGERGIDADTICQLCEIFGCTSDYLLGRSASPSPVISDADASLLRAYHAASLRDRALVDQILQAYAAADDSGKSAV